MGLQPMTPGAGLRPPVLVTAPNVDSAMMFNQQKSRAPELGDPFANQLDNGEYNSANSKLQEATASRNKAIFLSVFLSHCKCPGFSIIHFDMLVFGELVYMRLSIIFLKITYIIL